MAEITTPAAVQTPVAPAAAPATIATPPAAPAAAPTEQPAAEQSLGQKLLNLLKLGEDKGGAAAPATPPDEGGAGEGAAAPAANADGKTFTQADIDAAVAAALAGEQEKARLAKLSPEERAKAEASASAKEVETLKAQLLQRDLKQTAVGALSKAGLPVELADMLTYTSEAAMQKSLAAMQTAFTTALSAALTEKLRGKTPAGLGGAAFAEGNVRDQIAQNIRGGLN